MREYRTDVLVVGAGLAGLRAAARARREGGSVLIVHQGKGASGGVLAFNAVDAASGDSTELYLEDIMRSGGEINNPALAQRFVSLSPGLLASLKQYGYEPDKGGDGVYLRRHLGGNSKARSFYSGDGTGGAVTACLWRWLRENGAAELPRVRAWLPVVMNGGMAGVVAADADSGEEVFIRAAATVLAGGGIGRLFAGSTYPADVDASCEALGLLAGAELVDMEFVQFEPTVCFTHPAVDRMEMPTAMLGDGAKLLNGRGERFMLQYGFEREAGIEKAFMAKCISREIAEGRGSPNGGVCFDATDIPPEILTRYALRVKRLADAGIDLTKDSVEVKPVAHSHMGGIRIDENTATRVPGLFAAGECSGGLHGASRIAGNGGAEVLVMGDAAGEAAAKACGDVPEREAFLRAAREAVDGIAAGYGAAGAPENFAARIAGILARGCGILRDGAGLEAAAAELDAAESERLSASAAAAVSPERSVAALGQMLTARCILSAALRRAESRGAHCRADFPDASPEWKANIVHRLDNGRLITGIER